MKALYCLHQRNQQINSQIDKAQKEERKNPNSDRQS